MTIKTLASGRPAPVVPRLSDSAIFYKLHSEALVMIPYGFPVGLDRMHNLYPLGPRNGNQIPPMTLITNSQFMLSYNMEAQYRKGGYHLASFD